MPLRPPAPEQRLDLRRRRLARLPGFGGRRQRLDRGVARSSASFSGDAPAPVFVSTAAPIFVLRLTTRPGEVPGHRAAVTDEHVLAAAVELEPRPPRQRPALVVDHRAHVRHLLERRRRQHAVVAGRRGTRPTAPGRRSSTRACRARRRRRDRDRARAGRRPSTARRSSRARPARTRPASCATGRAGRGPAPAAPPPRCRRGRARRPRRAARRRGWSSATTCPARAPAPRRRSRRAAPRGSAPASSPRSPPAARAGARRSARASGRSSARARSRAGAR